MADPLEPPGGRSLPGLRCSEVDLMAAMVLQGFASSWRRFPLGLLSLYRLNTFRNICAAFIAVFALPAAAESF